MLLDVLADENITPERLSQYPAVILPRVLSLSDQQLAALWDFAAKGNLILTEGDAGALTERGEFRADAGIPRAQPIKNKTPAGAAEEIEQALQQRGGSNIEAPWTVRAAAYTQPERMLLHLVNYNREEGAPENNRTGPETERPKPAQNIAVHLRLPENKRASRVMLLAPDIENALPLKFEQSNGKAMFQVPKIKVYGVVAVEWKD